MADHYTVDEKGAVRCLTCNGTNIHHPNCPELGLDPRQHSMSVFCHSKGNFFDYRKQINKPGHYFCSNMDCECSCHTSS